PGGGSSPPVWTRLRPRPPPAFLSSRWEEISVNGDCRRTWSWRRGSAVVGVCAAVSTLVLGLVLGVPQAVAAEAPVGLGTAGSYSVLGGQTVTNTGPTTLSGDLGVSPGTAITGFPPGTAAGATHAADAPAGQ